MDHRECSCGREESEQHRASGVKKETQCRMLHRVGEGWEVLHESFMEIGSFGEKIQIRLVSPRGIKPLQPIPPDDLFFNEYAP